MADETYNGWTNYETWCVNLWTDDTESTQMHAKSLAMQAWSENQLTVNDKPWNERARNTVTRLADLLEDWHEESWHTHTEAHLPACVFHDLMNAALGEVDWREIAQSILEGHEIMEQAE